VLGSPYAINQGSIANSNYAISYTGANFNITTLNVSVTANSGQSKVYGSLDPALTFTSSPAVGFVLANGDAISFSGAQARASGETVLGSPYAINQGSIANSNYAISYTGSSFNITTLSVSVTANAGQSKVYGSVDPALTFTSSPAVGFVLPNGIPISFSGALSRTSGETVLGSPYAINQGSLANSNYAISYTGANFNITPLNVSVMANAGQSKSYGSPDPVFTFTSSPAVGFVLPNGIPVSFSGALSRAAGETVLGSPYAIYKGTLANSNYTISFTGANFTITPAAVTTSLTLTPNSQQYSDTVRYCAKITGGAPLISGGPQAAQTVTFKVGTQIVATNVPFVVSGADLKATYTGALLEPSPFGTAPTGQMAPGAHTVTATINGADPNYNLNSLTPTAPLTITQEDARITYTGPMNVATSSSSSTSAIVTLSATIQDITATAVAAGDTYFGDIRNAKITFINRDNNTVIASNIPVGLVNNADIKTGTAVYNWTTTMGQYNIGIIVTNYYTRNTSEDNQIINVYQPNGDFITGGGYIILTSSNGLKAGDAGTRNNFGFNVKYNKGGTNLQGNINTIIRRTEAGVMRVYQVKGNAMTSLSVDLNFTATHPYPTAVFNGKANITDITNPLSPLSVDGGATLQVTMTDAGEPGSSDKIGITVFNKSGGLWYTSNWNGTSTVQQTIAGGNLVVHGSTTGTTQTTSTMVPLATTVRPTETVTQAGKTFGVKVYGNPAEHSFILFVEGDSKENVRVSMYDVSGRLVKQIEKGYGQSIRFGEGNKAGVYFVEVRQGINRKVIMLLKE